MNSKILSIGSQLRRARLEKKLKQSDVARMTYFSKSTISKLENGSRDLSLKEASLFSKLYDKNIYFFLGER